VKSFVLDKNQSSPQRNAPRKSALVYKVASLTIAPNLSPFRQVDDSFMDPHFRGGNMSASPPQIAIE
jgi:hypothetical protein